MSAGTKTTLIIAFLLVFREPAEIGADGSLLKSPGQPDQVVTSPETLVEASARARAEGWTKHTIPPLEHIESITAESYSHPLPVADIAPFSVPKKYYRELLSRFVEAEPDKLASSESQELGTLRISLVGGRSVRICWFWAGHKDRLCFSWCGMRYRAIGNRLAADETLDLDAMVRRIHKKDVLHEND